MRRCDRAGRRRPALRRRSVRYGGLAALVVLAVLVTVALVEIRGVGLSESVSDMQLPDPGSAPEVGTQHVVVEVKRPAGDWFPFEIQVSSHGSLSIGVRDVVLEHDGAQVERPLPLADVRTTTGWPSSMSQQTWDDAKPWNGNWPNDRTETFVIRVPVPSCPAQFSALRFDASVLGFPEQYTVSLLDTVVRVQPIGGSCRAG